MSRLQHAMTWGKVARGKSNSSSSLPQTLALYGVLFPHHKEAAFANYRMWESVGFVISFAYSNFICLDEKLYVLIVVLILSMVLYAWVEWEEHKNPTVASPTERKVDLISSTTVVKAETKL